MAAGARWRLGREIAWREEMVRHRERWPQAAGGRESRQEYFLSPPSCWIQSWNVHGSRNLENKLRDP